MKLGIDARLLTQTGVGVYTYNLLNFLPSYLPEDWEVVVFARSIDKNEVPHADRYTFVESDFRWHTFSEQISFLKQLIGQKLDLMHFTYFSYPVLYKNPFISTIHDLTPVLFKTGKASTKSSFEYYPKFFAMSSVISSAVKHSTAVITPTQVVKEQLVKKYKVDPNKVYAILEGLNEKLINAQENTELKKQFSKPFFMYLGNFYPHKNIETLVDAFLNIDNAYDLVLIGPEDYFAGRIKSLIKDRGMSSRITLFHNPTLSDLVFFYKNAKALIHPSLSEGFGLTPIEAIHFNCPVIASDIEVFKETLGSNYISFDPHSKTSIAEAIEHSLKGKLKVDSKKILKKFSFDKMAEETVDIYKKAMQLS